MRYVCPLLGCGYRFPPRPPYELHLCGHSRMAASEYAHVHASRWIFTKFDGRCCHALPRVAPIVRPTYDGKDDALVPAWLSTLLLEHWGPDRFGEQARFEQLVVAWQLDDELGRAVRAAHGFGHLAAALAVLG